VFVRGAAAIFVVSAAFSCARPAGDAAAYAFELDCAASNTATAAEVHCVRTDTRTGGIQRVNILKLPISSDAVTAAPGPPGRYRTHCASASTTQRSDFYCVRLDGRTGEMQLVNLLKLPELPER
jgi:hypothetical protein